MRVVRFEEFIDEEDNVQWVVEGLLPSVGWTLLVGEKGVGKTTFALQLSKALQEGIAFLDREVVKTKVAYIQADSLTAEWREIVKGIGVRNSGLTVVDVPMGCMDNPAYVSWIEKAVSSAQFLVFDSFYKMTSVSINTERVLIPLTAMKSLAGNRPWLLLHHPSKSDANDGSGHNSISGDCSNLWVLFKSKLAIKKARLKSTEDIALAKEGRLWTVIKKKSESRFDFLGDRLRM